MAISFPSTVDDEGNLTDFKLAQIREWTQFPT